MRILTFNYEYPPLGGGGGVVSELIAVELAKQHEVVVLTSAYADLPRRERRGGVEIFRTPVLARSHADAASLPSLLTFPPSAWVRSLRALRGRQFDVVHSHFAVPTGPASLPVARRLRIPHVISLHGGDVFNPANRYSPHRIPPVRAAVRWVLNSSDAVVAQSSDTRKKARKYYRFRGAMEVIPLGIRQPPFEPASRRTLGLPEGVLLCITVGRLVKRKALDRLLRVMRGIADIDSHLVIVGDGPERGPLEALAAELGTLGRFTFTGRVSEERKWQLLEAADAYVSTTLHEGFGLVFLEAMTAGLPVICPDHGGQVDFLKGGQTGYLTPAGDDAALVAAIRRLATNRDEARRIGAHNREAAKGHSIEACSTAYESLFYRLTRRQIVT